MAKTKKYPKQPKDWSGLYIAVAVLMCFGIPMFIVLSPFIENIVDAIKEGFPVMLSNIAKTISIGLCIYCLLRTVLAVACNLFLPKIPMPKSKTLKLLILAMVGTFIGLVSPVWCLIVWVVTCLIGMATYSFV